MTTINQIMTKDVITVHENDTIEKCANLLTTHNLSGLPVVDEEGHVKGIITEGDLIRRSTKVQTPAYLELLGGIIYLDNPNKFLDEVKKSMGLFAHEVMTEDVITVLPETEVEQAANLLVRKKIKRLPVLDENDKLIGIVARKDIMTHLFHNE
ncbi:MAG TPA: CBS domain-containing protein [Pseudogracilibacillus sp.]|nr:CBS domain-containing protein [Pseudogracilibacillus sp.]